MSSTEHERHRLGEIPTAVEGAPVLAESTVFQDREGHVAHVMIVALAEVGDAVELEVKRGSLVGLYRSGGDHPGLISRGAVVSADECAAIHMIEIRHLVGFSREHDLPEDSHCGRRSASPGGVHRLSGS